MDFHIQDIDRRMDADRIDLADAVVTPESSGLRTFIRNNSFSEDDESRTVEDLIKILAEILMFGPYPHPSSCSGWPDSLVAKTDISWSCWFYFSTVYWRIRRVLFPAHKFQELLIVFPSKSSGVIFLISQITLKKQTFRHLSLSWKVMNNHIIFMIEIIIIINKHSNLLKIENIS